MHVQGNAFGKKSHEPLWVIRGRRYFEWQCTKAVLLIFFANPVSLTCEFTGSQKSEGSWWVLEPSRFLPNFLFYKFKEIMKRREIVKDTNEVNVTSLKSYWTPGGSRKGPMKQGLSVLSVLPLFSPGVFLEFCHQFFLNFGMVLEIHVTLCMTEPDFPEKKFLPQKLGKWTKNRVF